ncbi:MAG: GGDEF domain-containing protein [Lachnospiraceae bacterium]|nr:GGDEF domain-containing protein [Lachnospiraceae bacterium]
MTQTIRKNHLLVTAIGAVLLVFFFLLFLFRAPVFNRAPQYPVTKLENWYVAVNGKPHEDGREVPLQSVKTGTVLTGETWEISCVLPDAGEIPGVTAYLITLQAVIEAKIDGETVYTYGTEWYEDGSMLKRGICMIPLPADYTGRTLSVSFTATEPDAFGTLGPVLLGNEADLLTEFLQERRLPLFFGIFLCVFAFLQILWMPYLLLREGASPRPLFGAFITLLAGMYILGFYHVFEVFSTIATFSTLIEYLSLYLLPCAICAYIWTLMSGSLKRLYQYFVITDLAMIGMIIILHLMGIVHLTAYLTVSYMVTLAESLPYLLLTRGGIRSRGTQGGKLDRIADRLVFTGFALFAGGAIIDMIFFIQAKFFGGGESTVGIPFITVASILFTMALTAQYFLYGVSHLRADVTREQLEEKAYTDPLTGLANRIRSEQMMQQLKPGDSFVIISLDMDGLKQVNDSLGHAEGDRMLQGFANALKKVFGSMTLVGRMGGDEFIVIMTGEQCAILTAKLNELERELFDLNLDERKFSYSVSYGYATNQETHYGRRVRDIYMLADRRMYDMKRRRKQERAAEG